MLIDTHDTLADFVCDLILEPDTVTTCDLPGPAIKYLKKALGYSSLKALKNDLLGPGFWVAADVLKEVHGRRVLGLDLSWVTCPETVSLGHKITDPPGKTLYIATICPIICSAIPPAGPCNRTAKVILENGEHTYDGFSDWVCYEHYAEAIELPVKEKVDPASIAPPYFIVRSANERN